MNGLVALQAFLTEETYIILQGLQGLQEWLL